MAQLLLITDQLLKGGLHSLGDIVGVFNDSHQFSPTEINLFEILSIPGFTRQQLQDLLESITPQIRHIYRVNETEWTFVDLTVNLEGIEIQEAWFDGSVWRFLEHSPKFKLNISNISSVNKNRLKNINIDLATKTVILQSYLLEKIADNPVNSVEVELIGN